MKKNIFIIILSILVLSLGGYLVYDKVIDKDVKEEVKEESKNFDLVEAKKIVDKYALNYMFSRHLFKENMTEDSTIIIAINNTNSKSMNYSCSKAFPSGKLYGGQYIVEKEYFWGSCYESDNNIIYSYDDVNKVYKKMFGNDKELPKKMVSLMTYRYAYSEIYDAFIVLSCECGFGGGMIDFHYGIDKAIETNDVLEIFINYVEFEYDENNKKVYVSKKYDINVDSPDEFGVSEEEIEKLYDRAIKELNEEQITKYKFTFKKNDTGYYLDSIVKVVY